MLKTLLVLGALLVGIAIGIATGNSAPGVVDVADLIGSLWLRGLQMTVVPLVVALLITGILRTAQMATAGRLTVRAITTMIVLLWASAAMATLVTPALLGMFPLPEAARAALQGALAGAEPAGEVPPFTEFLRALGADQPDCRRRQRCHPAADRVHFGLCVCTHPAAGKGPRPDAGLFRC